MNNRTAILLLLLCVTGRAGAQREPGTKNFFRLYVDNDALILSSNATDWGYTSGLRIDFFYSPEKKYNGHFGWPGRLTGSKTVITRGWGLMQVIMAPQKTSLTVPEKHDYAYSGGLVAVYTVHAANPLKKINVQSECIIGMMGPPSLAEQTQSFFHRLIKDPLPMGWSYQLPTDLLVNYNVKAERSLVETKLIVVTGSGEFLLGSMKDGLSLDMVLQIGKQKKNYFSGLSNQYFAAEKPTVSLLFKATASLIAYDALLQGGLLNSQSPVHKNNSVSGTELTRQKAGGSLQLMLLFSARRFAATFSQQITSATFRGYGAHSVGNISLYYKTF